MKKRYIVIPIISIIIAVLFAVGTVVLGTTAIEEIPIIKNASPSEIIPLAKLQYKISKRTIFLEILANRYTWVALYENPSGGIYNEAFYKEGAAYAKELLESPIEELMDGMYSVNESQIDYEKHERTQIKFKNYIPLLYLSGDRDTAKAEIEKSIVEKDLTAFLVSSEFICFLGKNESISKEDKLWAEDIALSQIELSNESMKQEIKERYAPIFGWK